MTNTVNRNMLLGLLWGITVGLAFIVGTSLNIPANDLAEPVNYQLLAEVQTLLDRNYLHEQPTATEREYSAIRGMLSALEDRYTFFIDPPVAQSESDVLAGTYGGVGIEIQRAESGDILLFPFDDSPASRAGIEAGDILVAINGEAITLNIGQDAIDQMLRGEVKDGNGVTLSYQREDETSEVFIAFDVINVPSVTWRMVNDESIGYIKIVRFTNRTPDEFNEAIEALSENELIGVVIDLRNNSGGLLQEAVDTAGILLDGGVVVYEVRRDDERVFEAVKGDALLDVNVVVLINGQTASAAELVAGALRDRERGILIGQQSYGKGTVQQIYRLSDNSSLHVTSAEWLTPNRTRLDSIGLEPDIAMIPDENGRDVELGEAIRYLNQSQVQFIMR